MMVVGEELKARLNRLHDGVDRDFSAHLQTVQEFLRIPSISTERQAAQAAADFLQRLLRGIGAEVELVGEPVPLVYARIDADKEKTIFVYGMYDVQPVAGQAWSSPPFAADRRELPGIGECVVARGACNSKGPLVGFINALSLLKRQEGELPANLIFTIEGEEEVGSPRIEGFCRQRQGELSADMAFEPFWAEYGTDVDRPTIALGTKGIVSFELECRSGDWGGPLSRPIHSSVAAWIGSPGWRLLHAIRLLVDPQDELQVPALAPRDMERADRALLADLAKTFDKQRILRLMDARRFKDDLREIDLLEKYYCTPTIHITELSLTGGDVIPTSAKGKFAIRLVPGMDPAEAVDAIRAHLQRHGLGDISVTNLGGYPGVRTSLQTPINQAILAAYEYHGCQPQIIPWMASATPNYLFTDVLAIPYGSGGLGKAGGSHAVDEFFTIEGFKLFEKSIITLLCFLEGRGLWQDAHEQASDVVVAGDDGVAGG